MKAQTDRKIRVWAFWIAIAITGFIITVSNLTGCAGVRESIVDLSEEDIENVETLKEAASNLLETWPFYSGLIRGAVGDKIEKFPPKAVAAMDELDKIAKDTKRDDFILGYSLGIRVQMLSAFIEKALRRHAPEVLELVPLLR